MYCRNYTGTVSFVLCREVYYTVSLFGRVHYQRVHALYIQRLLHTHIDNALYGPTK